MPGMNDFGPSGSPSGAEAGPVSDCQWISQNPRRLHANRSGTAWTSL